MEKSCRNCIHASLGIEHKNKWFCNQPISRNYKCDWWEALDPFSKIGLEEEKTCKLCKHRYTDGYELFCGHEIESLDYVCDKWEIWKAKESESTPLIFSISSGLDELCRTAIEKWGSVCQVEKAIEELTELTLALIRWLNGKEPTDKIRDNIREEREDVEIMLQQLDVIFGRSEEWRQKKYEHLRQIVGDVEDD